MELSKRLQAVINLMPVSHTVCDVGCDHGYVAISFIQKGIAQKVIAMDVNAGPLEQARKHAELFGVTDKLEFRLSDGLQKVSPGEAECFLCAGMGGKLLVHIMSEGKEVMSKMKGAVLQPQSELSLVRRYIYENGWHIVKEDMVFEEDGTCPGSGKYYPMMYVEPGKKEIPGEEELLYGPLLLQTKHPVLMQYLEFSKELKQALISKLEREGNSEQARVRSEELKKELTMMENLLK